MSPELTQQARTNLFRSVLSISICRIDLFLMQMRRKKVFFLILIIQLLTKSMKKDQMRSLCKKIRSRGMSPRFKLLKLSKNRILYHRAQKTRKNVTILLSKNWSNRTIKSPNFTSGKKYLVLLIEILKKWIAKKSRWIRNLRKHQLGKEIFWFKPSAKNVPLWLQNAWLS